MNISRNVGTALLLGLVGALVGIALLLIFVFPIGSLSSASTENPPAAQESQGSNGGQTSETQGVSRERAGEIAVEHLGKGRVTGIGREDAHGAL